MDGKFSDTIRTIKLTSTVGLEEEDFQTYTCMHDEVTNLFYVNIGMNSCEGFLQSTFVNAVKLAEQKGATKVYFIVNRDNKDRSQYRKDFKMIDLKRVSSDEKKAIMESSDFLVYSRELI